MKKAWQDIKSFVTIALTVAFVILTFNKVINGEDFYNVYLIVVSFYFGTQFEKRRGDNNDL